MLYLEDYLEMIEHLPQELRDRFTEMRELDLAVQNNMDSLDKKSRVFFQQCKRGELQHESMDTEFHSLRCEYFKVMEDADEKVAIATQIHELVERYLRRLDSELFKFKCELEADNNGITEILEKRSLELDGNNSTAATALLLSITQKENRYYNASSGSNSNLISASINSAAGIITSCGSGSLLVGATAVSSLSGNSTGIAGHQRHRKLEKRRETICTVPVQEKRANLNQSLPTVSNVSTIGGNIVNPLTTNHVNSIATNIALPVASSSVTAPISSNIVRQLPTNLTAHSVLSSSSSNSVATAAAATAAAASAAPTAAAVTAAAVTAAAVTAAAAAVATAAANAAATVPPAASNSVGVAGVASAGGSVVTGSHGNASVSYNLQQLGGGAAASSAIAAAASQAIVTTQQMQQGRRTASLKASYEAIHGAGVASSTEFWSAAAAHNSNMQPATGPLPTSSLHHHHQQHQQHHQHHQHHQEKKHKKKLNSSLSIPGGIAVQSLGGSSSANSIASSSSSISVDSMDLLSTASTAMQHASLSHGTLAINPVANQLATSHATTAISSSTAAVTTAAVVLPTVNNMAAAAIVLPSTALAPGANLTISDTGLVVEQTIEGEWSYDPNEPRYCTCNQVSYGDMVACDNDACPYEWFHYPCVGITQPPKGKWFCPKCTASMRRRGNRKN